MAKNKFSLSNTLEAFIDVGADFLFGTKKSSSVSQADIYVEPTIEREGGFLGKIARTAYKTFGSGATDKTRVTDSSMSIAEIKDAARATSRYTDTTAGVSTPTRFIPSDPLYQDALRRRLLEPNYDSVFERMTSQYTIPPKGNIPAGKAMSPGSTTIQRKTTAPRVTV